jgi:para-aminobenzoate synthetase/4-amino-4-deoxychorismate lyase
VFETLLVSDGRPLDLRAHLARLARSVHELYGRSLPPALDTRAIAQAAAEDEARMRINARPAPGGIDISIELTPVPERDAPTRLQPVMIPGGIGPHKWIDRQLLDSLRATVAPGTEPLLCDLDGYVLETPRANVFAVNTDGTLLTPPADGRILAGVTRARVLARASELGLDTEIGPITLSDLGAAAEIFLTGSLAGVEPALLGHEQTRATQVSDQLRTNLYKSPRQAILR